MKDLITFIKKNSIGSYKEDVKLEKNTTYKVGGVASLFVYPKNTDKLIILLDKLNKEGIKHKVLGFGSNVIFSDKRYDGVIIKLDNFNDVKIKDTTVVAGAGVSLVKLSYKAQKEGNEERTIWYYGKATGIKKSIETIEKMKDYGIIL